MLSDVLCFYLRTSSWHGLQYCRPAIRGHHLHCGGWTGAPSCLLSSVGPRYQPHSCVCNCNPPALKPPAPGPAAVLTTAHIQMDMDVMPPPVQAPPPPASADNVDDSEVQQKGGEERATPNAENAEKSDKEGQ